MGSCFRKGKKLIEVDIEPVLYYRDLIYEGVHSKIYKCCRCVENHQPLGTHHVQKCIFYKKPSNDDELILKMVTDIKEYDNEVLLLSELKDEPHIVNIIGCNPKQHYIITELIHEDLFEWTSHHTATPEQFWIILLNLIKAIKECHSHHIVHSDIKLENIGIEDDNRFYLSLLDFGVSIKLDERVEYYRTFNLYGSQHYTSPEVIKNKAIHRDDMYCIDYWQLGIVLYILLVKRYPFEGHSTNSIQKRIIKGQLKWKAQIDSKCQSVIADLLKIDPKERLNFDTIDEDEWIKDYII